MLRNALLSLLILLTGKCYAQESFFVLIQAEHNQPFYVKMADKSLSSNAKGRLILSQLKSGSHRITIGSPQQLFPEQQYTFNIGDKDLEFELKDLAERGWGLFNPQTQELMTAGKKETSTAHNEGIKKDDAFSRLMAGVVSDTAVMYNTYAMEEVLKDSPVAQSKAPAAPVKVIAKTDSPTVVSPPPVSGDTARAVAQASGTGSHAASTHTASPSTPKGAAHGSLTALPGGTVVKLSERKTPKGLRIAFADRPRGRKADTIILIIPLDSVATVKKDSAGSSSTAAELQKNHPDSNKAALYRTSTNLISPAGGDKPITSGEHKPDSVATPASTETVVRDNPDTIHVYINAAKKTAPGKGDSAVAADQKGVTDQKGVSDPKVVPEQKGTVDQKTVRNKPDTAHSAPVAARTAPVTGKETPASGRETPASGKETPASGREAPASGKELYRSKPDSSQKGSGSKIVVVNSDCRNFASDYDVDKLRVKMLEGPKDEDRIQTAQKVYKLKCFTTKQIKALSEVFSTDAGKFRFFEASYPFVSDDHFRELGDLLADPVYNGKFRAMTGQQ